MSKTKRQKKRLNLSLRCAGNLAVNRVASQLYEDIDTPVSLSCYLLLKYNELEQLVTKEINPLSYNSPYTFRDDYLAVSYLRKYPSFEIGTIDREKTAWQKFLDAEESCTQSNRRFRMRESGVFSTPEVESVLLLTQSKISHILGLIRKDCLLDSGFGPGVTSSCGGDRTGLAEKFKSELNATRDSLKYVKPLLGLSPIWSKAINNVDAFEPDFCDLPVRVVNYSRVAFVPKDAKVDRTIGIEPHLNIYFQKGVGSYIRNRLRNAGCDLNDQTRNQELARLASTSGALATIDLSSASDTISQAVVWDLLPYDWACFLDDLRSKYYQDPYTGSIKRFAKWSSMGNGYTFELESLIFFALADSVCKYLRISDKVYDLGSLFLGSDLVGVYGDDIIVPVEAFELISKVISYLGFSLNEKKSFSSGPFRESCGKDWFLGVDVRPVFLKKEVVDVPSAYIVANNIRRLAFNRNNKLCCDRRFKRCYDVVVSLISPRFRFPIPEGYGDIGLISSFDEASPRTIRRKANWIEGYEFRALLPKAVRFRTLSSASVLIQSLIGSHDSPTGGFSTYRNRVVYSLKHVSASNWLDLGAWF